MHAQHTIEQFDVLIERNRSLLADAGIVHQHVNTAEAIDHRANNSRNVLRRADVAAQSKVCTAELGCTLDYGVFAQIDQHDMRHIIGQPLGRGPTDAVACSGDDRYKVLRSGPSVAVR